MDFTYIDYFNYYLREFLNELLLKYPELKQNVLGNYRSLLEGKDGKNDMYVKFYYSKINNHLIKIAKKDESLFDNEGIILIEGVDFHHVWKQPRTNEQYKIVIWKYLQLLMIIGRKAIPNHREVLDMLNKVGGEINVPAKVKEILAKEDEEDNSDNNGGLGIGNLFDMVNGLMGGGKDLNIGDMLSELEKKLGDMPEMEQFKSFLNDDDDDEEEDNEEEDSNPATKQIFDDLSAEVGKVIRTSDIPDNCTPEDALRIMKENFSGENIAKMYGIANSFSKRVDQDIKSGKLKQEDLARDTFKKMKQVKKGIKNSEVLKKNIDEMMANNPEFKKEMESMGHNNLNQTRDRLREKLEKMQREQSENN